MRGRLSSLVGIASLTSVVTLALVPGFASASVSRPVQGPNSELLAGSIAAQGQLAGVSGPAVGGVRVVLYAWPVTSVVSKVRPGQPVPLKVVGSAVTSASGHYAIRVTSPAALLSSAELDGTVNLEIMASTPAGFSVFSFPRRLVPTARGTLLASASDGAAVRAVPQVANLHLMPLMHARSTLTPAIQCGLLSPVQSYGARNTVVGATYSHVPGVTMNFTYGSGQNSGLGVAVSSSGAYGSWSGSGSYSISSTSSESFPAFSGATSHRYRTEFVYEKYLVECDGFQTQPKSFAGGATTTSTSPPSAGYCVVQAAGSTFRKSSSSAYTFSGGVGITSAIGINLSAHTGYNATAELTYHFTQRRDLCGTSGYPGGTPRRIVAGL